MNFFHLFLVLFYAYIGASGGVQVKSRDIGLCSLPGCGMEIYIFKYVNCDHFSLCSVEWITCSYGWRQWLWWRYSLLDHLQQITNSDVLGALSYRFVKYFTLSKGGWNFFTIKKEVKKNSLAILVRTCCSLLLAGWISWESKPLCCSAGTSHRRLTYARFLASSPSTAVSVRVALASLLPSMLTVTHASVLWNLAQRYFHVGPAAIGWSPP